MASLISPFQAIFSSSFRPQYWKDIWWLILKKPLRCATINSWTFPKAGLNPSDEMRSESLLVVSVFFFFVLFFFLGWEGCHEHLANNPTYPAKSRERMQCLCGKTAYFAKASHRWFIVYPERVYNSRVHSSWCGNCL